MNFRANWICRGSYGASRVDPISPKLALVKLPEPETATTPFPPKLGALKFGWLRMLKNSDLNSIRTRSVAWNSLKSEKSIRLKGGPATWSGGPPRVDRGQGNAVHVAGWLKAARFPKKLSLPLESMCSPRWT